MSSLWLGNPLFIRFSFNMIIFRMRIKCTYVRHTFSDSKEGRIKIQIVTGSIFTICNALQCHLILYLLLP